MNPKLKTINFSEVVNALLACVSEREADVLKKRNGLDGTEGYTLEEIGKEYNVTRERVRQIENEGMRKLRESQADAAIKSIETAIGEYLVSHGGAMAEDHLMEQLLADRADSAQEAAIEFLLTSVLSRQFERVEENDERKPVWKIGTLSIDVYLEITNHLFQILKKTGRPLSLDAIADEIKEHDLFDYIDKNSAANDRMIEALLRLRTDLNKNILGEWGLSEWKTITPKRMTDKAYLILKREARPLHFEDITDLINQACFDNKKACAATVHNELILDDKYVLVGRGMYALKEHGYEEGTVTELIEKLLKKNGPLDKQSIIDEVLKQRQVQKTTVTLALMKKDRFARSEDGTYALIT